MYKDTEEVRTKLLNRHTRPYWEVWLWDPEATLFGGWIALEDGLGQKRQYNRDVALAGLALARETYGPVVLKLMRWTVAEEAVAPTEPQDAA